MATPNLEAIDPEGSILFLGSGFSAGATNIAGGKLPTGNMLRQSFAKIIGVDPNAYELQTLAEEVATNPKHDLYQLLYETFTVKSLTTEQLDILSLPWLRVYTTNYDDVVENAYSTHKRNIRSFSYNQEKPRKLHPTSIIHLHGAICQTTPENVKDQLILTEHSYIRQHFERSLWYDEFIRDIRFSTHCFFLGYNLSDYHISALLFQEISLEYKTFFITEKVDQIFTNRVSKYGTVLPIAIDGFAELCSSLPRLDRLVNPFNLKSLRYIDPFKDKKTLASPTPIEVLYLVAYGAFNEQRCISSLPGVTYVVPRRESSQLACDYIGKIRTLLVHSRLGNGKSIFLSILAHRLSENGYKCFRCQDVSPTLTDDAKSLSMLENIVILFDSYNVAVDALKDIAEVLPNAKFVITIRTGIQEVRLHEIQQRLPSPFERINLNKLSQSERDDFTKLLDGAGILAKNLRQEMQRCEDIREIVTTIYKNEEIRKRLEKELKPLLEDRAVRTIIIASHLLQWIGQKGRSAFLRIVTGKDAYAEATRFKETASDFLLFKDDELEMHSAVFSEYLIDHFFDAEDVIDIVYSIIVEAVKRKRERGYQAITSKLMQVSTLSRLVKNSVNKDILLSRLFDRLHRDIGVNEEPLFWLQYSILMLESRDLTAANNFLETAYVRASNNPGFRTFQIDTHALRLFLILEQNEKERTTVSRFDLIMEKFDLVISMVGEDSHRSFALRVLNEVEPFIRARLSALRLSERNALLIQMDRLIAILQRLPESTGSTNSKEVLGSIERSRGMILKDETG